ncbi:polysaccharide biosynthesis tyrosine autokinase [candidate division KSB1 bacterium]|nr:polysaccharide biosynthesis tyrosine autokinase [candidate division KSB1 bacterium]
MGDGALARDKTKDIMEQINNTFGANGHGLNGLNNKEASLKDYLAILYRGRWIILIAFLVTLAAVTYYTFTTPPVYEASTIIMIDEKQGMGESLFDVAGFSQQRTLINNQVEILKSRSLNQSVLQRLLSSPERDSLALLEGLGEEVTLIDILENLRESITVQPVRDTDLIAIKVRAASPFEAAYLAELIVTVYQEKDRDLTQGEIFQVVRFIEEQLSRKEQDLKSSEETLKDFMENEKIASLGDEASQIVEQGAQFESLYKEALINFEVTNKRLEFLKNQLGRSKETLEAEIAQVSSPLVLQLRIELAEIERNVAVFLSQGVGKRDPQVRFEQQKLDAIKRRLTEEIRILIIGGLPADDPLAQAQELVVQILEAETELIAIEARADGLKRVVDSYNVKLESLPEKNVQLARLERNRKVDESLYMMMREKYEESRIKQAGQIGKVRMLDKAVPPIDPISPKKKLNLIIGVMLGLAFGMGISFLREMLDTSVRRFEEIEHLGLSLLATIPQIDSEMLISTVDRITGRKNNHASANDAASMRLVTHFRPKSPVSEAYRTLRTNLHFSHTQNKLTNFLVTSAGPGEGKSTTVANLAIAMSLQGTRTLLIDADLRRPVLHRTFALEKNRGLTNVLIGDMSLDDAVQKSSVKNLDILTSGLLPPNPAELLGSAKMRELILEVGERYDLCLFDTPPLVAVTDAAVLAKELGGVLLVIRSGVTQRDALVRGVELLHNVKARILGAVLNGVNRENSYGSYYYYQQYYYDNDQAEKKRKKKSSKKSFRSKVAERVNVV